MVLRFLLITLILLSCSLVFGSNLAADNQDLTVKSLGANIKYLVEEDSSINLEYLVANLNTIDWKVSQGETPNFGFNLKPHWFWVTVSNESLKSVSWLLQVYYPLIDFIDVYHLKSDGSMHQWHTGDRLPYNSRPIDHPDFLFPLELGFLEQTQLLIRIKNAGAMQAPMKLWNEREFFKLVQKETIPQGIFFGLFMVLILYNLFLYLSTRDLSFLYYVVFASGFLLYFMTVHGYGFQYLWSDSIIFQQYGIYLFISMTLFGMSEFTINFLNITKKYGITYLMLRAITIATALCLLSLLFIPYKITIQIIVLITFYASVISTIVGIKGIKDKGTSASLYASGWIVLAVGFIILVLDKFAIIPSSEYTALSAPISVVIFSLLLSFALGYRIQEERKNRMIAEKNFVLSQTESLEAKLKANKLEYQGEQLRIRSEAEIQAKNSFLAMMSHEIRTPLNGIMGLSHLLKNTDLNEKQKQYIDTIFISGESLLIIINDILDYSKILAGKLDIECIPVDIFELVNSCTSILSNILKENNINLYVSVSPAVPFVIKSDPIRLRQVVLNYLSNAIKFSNNKDIHLNISFNPTESELEINVIDKGIGISKDTQNILFNAFSQADSSTTREYGGSGLGLAICKQIALLTGGDVGVNSEEGLGSHFWFTCKVELMDLPIQDFHVSEKKFYLSMLESASDFDFIESQLLLWNCQLVDTKSADSKKIYNGIFIDHKVIKETTLNNIAKQFSLPSDCVYDIGDFDETSLLCRPLTTGSIFEIANNSTVLKPNEAHRPDNTSDSHPLNGLRILIAEDNYVNQMVITAMIKKMGAEFTLVENGKLAVDQMAANPNDYDVILMDCEMPIMDGFTASKLIQQAASNQTHVTPIIALTAHAMDQHIKQAKNSGMTGFISKPVNQKRLVEYILNTLQTTHKK
ncbi:MAG: signal transduction histidine kinase/CheY-like chemotaxis protein [Psychrobacter glaciei]|jgi:signal transduction histidine kinase/CheY-like chemotaxis protein